MEISWAHPTLLQGPAPRCGSLLLIPCCRHLNKPWRMLKESGQLQKAFHILHFWYDRNVGCFLLHQNRLLKIAHGSILDVWSWNVLEKHLGGGQWLLHKNFIVSGYRALMKLTVQRLRGRRQGSHILLDPRTFVQLLWLCQTPHRSPAAPSCPVCLHPSSVPLVLTTCAHSLNLILIFFIATSHTHYAYTLMHTHDLQTPQVRK